MRIGLKDKELKWFRNEDVRTAVLEFEKYLNYMKEFSKENWEKEYNYNLILSQFKQLFGDFEK